jgi:hypothetical protein
MPYFRSPFSYQQSLSSVFEQELKPGALAPQSGIYRCDNCGFEIAVAAGSGLPLKTMCAAHGDRWNSKDGVVLWRLVAAAINTNGA